MWQKIILCCLIVTSMGEIRMDIYDMKEDSKERLKSDARELVETCLTNNSSTIMISKKLFDYNWNPDKNPLMIIDNVFKKQITGFLPAYPTYVLFFQSIESLKEIINHLKKSTLWSIKSPFVIVETESRCKNTRRVLEFMWKQDLLSVYYLCNQKYFTVILTLNPYASYAPKPWALVEEFGGSNKNMTLYSLQYSKDPELCKSITFKKTDHLESVNIKLTLFSLNRTTIMQISHGDHVKKLIKLKLMNIFQIPAYINTTPTLEIIQYPNSSQLTQGFVQQLVDQTHDVHGSLMPITETDYKYVDVIADYFHEHEFFILTKKADFLTVISEVSNDVDFVVMTIVVFVMFTIAMVLINREDICGALMDSVKLVVNMGLESPLNRLAMKLILFCGFLFAFLIVPNFQGHVFAILSKPVRRNVETLEDLYENKFHVYHYDKVGRDIINKQLWVTNEDKKYLHPRNSLEMQECFKNAKTNVTIACIHSKRRLRSFSIDNTDVYVSKTPIFKKQFVHWARKNWPLKHKFDKMALKTSEPGLESNLRSVRWYERLYKTKKMKNRIEAREEYDKFDYDELVFIYYFVGFLSAFGAMVFVIKIILARWIRIHL
ncbi:GSCOCG00003509001-RA-CDS [Cotesia congregata]|uniref:Uncharacterized protein n=1 Tax=Cotesia congregata TaxID=51543 RepID=A0A8J2H5Z1_COTCN|nr:GSCOCG00003509001-RA-CDS [Cotesia congregata]CAG5077545.1 Protein of unknown function [Cotesia congregata]